jgi:hypothetical protein
MRSALRLVLSLAPLALSASAFAQAAPGKPAEIPEPAALALFVLGIGVVGAAIRRREQ